MKTRMRSISLAIALAGSLLAVPPATAFTVIDPTNLIQNTLTAIRTLEQINNQVRQLQNEAQMLINQARNLAGLDFNVVNRLRSTLATTERLIAEAQGLAYDVANMDREFARLYPHEYAASVSGDRMAQDARERWRHTLDGLRPGALDRWHRGAGGRSGAAQGRAPAMPGGSCAGGGSRLPGRRRGVPPALPGGRGRAGRVHRAGRTAARSAELRRACRQ